MVMCAIGAYTVHNSTFDVVMMLVFGVAGYFMKKTNYPMAPMVLAIVLGDKAENGSASRCSPRKASWRFLVQQAGRHHLRAVDADAVLAVDPGGVDAPAREQS